MTLRKRTGALLAISLWALAIMTALSFGGRYAYPLDFLSHFRAHLVAACLMLTLAGMLVWRWRTAFAAAGVMAANLLALAPSATAPVMIAASGDTVVTVASFNIWGRNPDLERATDVLDKSGADIILLQEVGPQAIDLFKALKTTYPWQYDCLSVPYCDGAILARWPWLETGTIASNAHRSPLVWATFERNGHTFTVASTHLDRPTSLRQGRQIEALATSLAPLPRPLVLAGDFNAAPWSYAITRLIETTDLVPLAGLRPTWPAHLGWPQLPIDHVLVSKPWRNLGAALGPFAGSDHRPVIARLALSGNP